MSLREEILPRIQDLYGVGGGGAAPLFRGEVLDAIDEGADAGDRTLAALRSEFRSRAAGWKQVEDHAARSVTYETYCEATFYLAASKSVAIEGVPPGERSTPDFRTLASRHVSFELKTIDVAEPAISHPAHMAEGLDSLIRAEEMAGTRGVGYGEQEISPHGNARTWAEVVVQVMKKLSGNIKPSQYYNNPTFLVANLGRSALRVEPKQLCDTFTEPEARTFEGGPIVQSGQLLTIASHEHDRPIQCYDNSSVQ